MPFPDIAAAWADFAQLPSLDNRHDQARALRVLHNAFMGGAMAVSGLLHQCLKEGGDVAALNTRIRAEIDAHMVSLGLGQAVADCTDDLSAH